MLRSSPRTLLAGALLLALALPWLASLGVGLHLLLSDHAHDHEPAAAHGTLLVLHGRDHTHAVPDPEHRAVLAERSALPVPQALVAADSVGPELSPPSRPTPSWLGGRVIPSAKSPPIDRLCVLRL